MLLVTLNLPKSLTFLRNFCKGDKIYRFSSKVIFGQVYRHLAIFSGHTITNTKDGWEKIRHTILTIAYQWSVVVEEAPPLNGGLSPVNNHLNVLPS